MMIAENKQWLLLLNTFIGWKIVHVSCTKAKFSLKRLKLWKKAEKSLQNDP
jgi:hypothetical protein